MKAGWKPHFRWLLTVYSALGVPGACIVAPLLLAREHFIGKAPVLQCGLNPLWASRVRAQVGAPHDLGFLMSGLVPHALIKMVCTHHFTFQTSHNERGCQMPHEKSNLDAKQTGFGRLLACRGWTRGGAGGSTMGKRREKGHN
jgi:hypothetical protein